MSRRYGQDYSTFLVTIKPSGGCGKEEMEPAQPRLGG